MKQAIVLLSGIARYIHFHLQRQGHLFQRYFSQHGKMIGRILAVVTVSEHTPFAGCEMPGDENMIDDIRAAYCFAKTVKG